MAASPSASVGRVTSQTPGSATPPLSQQAARKSRTCSPLRSVTSSPVMSSSLSGPSPHSGGRLTSPSDNLASDSTQDSPSSDGASTDAGTPVRNFNPLASGLLGSEEGPATPAAEVRLSPALPQLPQQEPGHSTGSTLALPHSAPKLLE